MRFINTKRTDTHYNSRLKLFVNQTVVQFKMTRHAGSSKAEAVGAPANAPIQPMSFNEPEMFVTSAGFVPYDPLEMRDVKQGVPKPLFVCFGPDGGRLRQPLTLEVSFGSSAVKVLSWSDRVYVI